MYVIKTLAKGPVGIGIINNELTICGNIMRLDGRKVRPNHMNVRMGVGEFNTPSCR